MKALKKKLFPTAQDVVKKGTVAMLCMVMLGILTVSCKPEVSDIRLNKTELTLSVGETETLTETVLPTGASNKAVDWKSSDNEVATVDNNGLVTAIAAGTALITATTKDGGKTATCSLTVLCNCIMDTLKGEWSWVKISSGWSPIRDNTFKSILKFLNQNADSSINYEHFVEDTLFSKGSFQYYYQGMWMKTIGLEWDWYFNFRGWNYFAINKDYLCFYDGAVDGTSYYYQKINND